jgi:hypothetical protein
MRCHHYRRRGVGLGCQADLRGWLAMPNVDVRLESARSQVPLDAKQIRFDLCHRSSRRRVFCIRNGDRGGIDHARYAVRDDLH